MTAQPEVTALERQATQLSTTAEALTITDAESFTTAGEMVKALAGYVKRVEEVLSPIVEAAHQAHKVAVAQRDALLKPALAAKRLLGNRMADWEMAQAQARREAEAAAAREQARLEREALAQAEAEQARLQAAAETRRLEEAAALEATGDREGAARLIEAPITAPIVTPAPVFRPSPPIAAPPKVEGVSFRTEWRFRIVDPAKIPREYLDVSEKRIGAVVRAMKGRTLIPGVTVYEERVSSVRSA